MATPPTKRGRPAKRAPAGKRVEPMEDDPELAALLEEIKQTDAETQELMERANKVQRKLRSVS